MTTTDTDLDPKGEEAAVKALDTALNKSMLDVDMVKFVVLAYFGALNPEFRKWARSLSEEAYVQGFIEGQDRGRRDLAERGARARVVTERLIRHNEYPHAPICGTEMDGFPGPIETP